MITRALFVPFAIYYMRTARRLDYLWAVLSILAAACFIFGVRGNDFDQPVSRIARQSHLMDALPNADARIGSLERGGLLLEFLLPAQLCLRLLMGDSGAVVGNGLSANRQPGASHVARASVLIHDCLHRKTTTR
jgi:hypothetical protein